MTIIKSCRLQLAKNLYVSLITCVNTLYAIDFRFLETPLVLLVLPFQPTSLGYLLQKYSCGIK